VASSLAQTSYLNSDTCRIVQTHKDRWSSYVSKLQLSFYTCWSQCIYCITIVFLLCSKIWDRLCGTVKARALWNSQKVSHTAAKTLCGNAAKQRQVDLYWHGDPLRLNVNIT